MKTSIFVLGAAALLLSSGVANASPDSRIQSFLDHASTQARSIAVAAGCDLDGQPVRVQSYVASDGRLKSVQVIGTTGSHDTDRAIERSLRNIDLADMTPELIDAKLTFVIGGVPTKAR